MGPFPAGFILHSYLGSAQMVPEFSKLGAYFSFSGFLMSMEAKKAKKMLKMVSLCVLFFIFWKIPVCVYVWKTRIYAYKRGWIGIFFLKPVGQKNLILLALYNIKVVKASI